MENNKLLGMTDFVLHENRFKEDSDTAIFNVTNYAHFLKTPLTLGMFIPCDLEGKVLVEPKAEHYFEVNVPADKLSRRDMDGLNDYNSALSYYEDAKELVLFEGFKLEINDTDKPHYSKSIVLDGVLHVFWFDSSSLTWDSSKGISKIEDLVKYNLTLTPSALKTIGL